MNYFSRRVRLVISIKNQLLNCLIKKPKTNPPSDASLFDEIRSETPIRSTSEDRLRRVEYADRIATILSQLSPREGRVFAIRGGWGFGKSSLKNLITERLKSRSNAPAHLDFNPWQWGDSNAIAHALFLELARRLGGKHSPQARKRSASLRRYGSILTSLSGPLKKAGHSDSRISSVVTNASVIAVASAVGFNLPSIARVVLIISSAYFLTTIAGAIFNYLGRDRSIETLDQIREDLESRLSKLKSPLIVFVDDIDRLEPEQIRTLLKQVKANANLPNIVFVLLFQPSIVERALDPIANQDGRAFLEKIVQANFDLPAVPRSTINSIFLQELSELVGGHANEDNGFTEVRWGHVSLELILPKIRNLRDARRLLSSIAIHMPLHVSQRVFEVNIIDFLLIETVRVFEPGLYEKIIFNQATAIKNYPDSKTNDLGNKISKVFMENIPASLHEITKSTISELFPNLEWAFGGGNYTSDFYSQWLKERRACTSRYFSRYFELQTPPGELSESLFIEFIEASSSDSAMTTYIGELESQNLLVALITKINENTERLPIENAETLLIEMFKIGEKLSDRDGNGLLTPWTRAWKAIESFLPRIPDEDRANFTLSAFRNSKALLTGAMIIHLNDPEDAKNKSISNFNPQIPTPTINAMKAIWLQIIKSRTHETKELLKHQALTRLLYIWGKYDNSMQQPKSWVTRAIREDIGFALFASRMMETTTSFSSAEGTRTHYTFTKERINDFIGVDTAKARCQKIRFDDFPEHKHALQVLLDHLDVWLGIKELDHLDQF